MRQRSRFLAAVLVAGLVVLLGPAAGTASATTIDDLIKLKASKPPVSDDVLIALIESDGSLFHITADDIPGLRQKGLSNEVVIAMLLTATREREREEARQAAALTSAPQAVPIEQPIYTAADVTPVTPEITSVSYSGPGMAAPPSIPYVVQTVSGTPRLSRTVEVPIAVPVYVPIAVPVVRKPQPAPEPVYWGFGGKRRPDTWAEPTTAPRQTAPPQGTTDNRNSRTGRGGGGG